MKTLRKLIRDLFGFSGKEINGFLILLPLTLILVCLEPLYRLWISNRENDFTAESQKLDSLVSLWETEEETKRGELPPRQVSELFAFDPNKTSPEDLQRLGFSEGLSTRIANYRQKGGVFRVKGDLLKIYGMDSTFYSKLYGYIDLPETNQPRAPLARYDKPDRKASGKKVELFNLNTADTAILKTVNGIGPTLALRIVRFREKLGGFIKQDQLNEVYGLDAAVVSELNRKSFIADNFTPGKININQADEKQLSAHPYIKKFMANAIVTYRFQHGNFKDVNDLRNIRTLREEDLEKVLPYLAASQE